MQWTEKLFQLVAHGGLMGHRVSPLLSPCLDDADQEIKASMQVATGTPTGLDSVTSALGMCDAAASSSMRTDFS